MAYRKTAIASIHGTHDHKIIDDLFPSIGFSDYPSLHTEYLPDHQSLFTSSSKNCHKIGFLVYIGQLRGVIVFQVFGFSMAPK